MVRCTTDGFSIVHGAVHDEDEYVFAPEQAADGLRDAPSRLCSSGTRTSRAASRCTVMILECSIPGLPCPEIFDANYRAKYFLPAQSRLDWSAA